MSGQCPYIRPRDERKFLCCALQTGHAGDHLDGHGNAGGAWVLPDHYRTPTTAPTALEQRLARVVVELCIAAGHPDDGSAPSVPKGKCACEVVPEELVPPEYR